MVGLVSGCPAGTYEYDHRVLSNAGIAVVNASCNVTLNNGQVYSNTTDSNGWVSFCVNSSSGINETQCKNPDLYDAVLSDAFCPDWTYLDGRSSFAFKIANNVGEPLEAQDCYVRVFNERGYMVEDLGTNLIYDNQTFLDSNGNYIATAGVPLSSASGVYSLAWNVRSKDENGFTLYRANENYTVVADCNGQRINCTFAVDNREPLHMDETVEYTRENMQVITFGVALVLIGWFFIIPALKKGGIFAGGGLFSGGN